MIRYLYDACAMQLKGQAQGLEGGRVMQDTRTTWEIQGCAIQGMPLLYIDTVNR